MIWEQSQEGKKKEGQVSNGRPNERQSYSSSLRVILGTAAKYSLKGNGFPASQEEKKPTAKQEHRALSCLHLGQLIQIAELYAHYLKYFILIHLFPQKLFWRKVRM